MADYIPTSEPVTFNPNPITFVFGILSFILKIAGYALYIFALAVIILPDLRNQYLNWMALGIIVGYIFQKVAKYIWEYFGPFQLKFTMENMIVSPIIGRKRKYDYDHILHIDVKSRRLFTFLPKNFEVFTSDAKFFLRSLKWMEHTKLEEIMERYHNNVDNIYVRNAYYKNSVMNSFANILSTTQGKLGFGILVLYFTMASIGGIAYLIDPPITGQPYSWILWNPEYVIYLGRIYPNLDVLNPPSSDFWMGTDFGGRDIFSRMIFGTTITMAISLIAASIVTVFIATFGLTSAIYGGAWDSFITRLSDVLLTFPQVVWIVLISVFSTPFRIGVPGGFFLAVYLGMSFVMWPLGARLVRSEVLEALSAEYIQAIDLVGAKRSWIIRKHVLPKVIPTILLLFFYQISDIVIGISLIGYLGFGSESTTVWGSDLAKAFQGGTNSIESEWWTILFPSLFIFGIVLGLTLFSDALRDTYASKYRGGIEGTLHSSMGGDQ